jgi:hypothetical protein
MDKKEVQKLVRYKDGTPVSPDDFSWTRETRTFSTEKDNLVVDFTGINDGIIYVRHNSNVVTGDGWIINTGDDSVIKTGYSCIAKTGSNCTFEAWDNDRPITIRVKGSGFLEGRVYTSYVISYAGFVTGDNCEFESAIREISDADLALRRLLSKKQKAFLF